MLIYEDALLNLEKVRKLLICEYVIKRGDETIPLKMDRTLFARMALLGQPRNLDLKTIYISNGTIALVFS